MKLKKEVYDCRAIILENKVYVYFNDILVHSDPVWKFGGKKVIHNRQSVRVVIRGLKALYLPLPESH